MKKSVDADVVIVGLGVSGLSAALRCVEAGLSVIGVEQYHESGALGTSSAGLTRIFRTTQPDPKLKAHSKYDI